MYVARIVQDIVQKFYHTLNKDNHEQTKHLVIFFLMTYLWLRYIWRLLGRKNVASSRGVGSVQFTDSAISVYPYVAVV